MENVKGILSSRVGGAGIFDRIVTDLSAPGSGLEYEIRSFVKAGTAKEIKPRDFVIKAERFGVPQARHRVILFGIRSDVARSMPDLLLFPDTFVLVPNPRAVTVEEVLSDLPRLRSRLSRESDSHSHWLAAISEAYETFLREAGDTIRPMGGEIRNALAMARAPLSTGAHFLRWEAGHAKMRGQLKEWFYDPRLGGVIQHEARSHMRSDLHRYLFAAAYARLNGVSPKIKDFPKTLLPRHENVNGNGRGVPFADRFRVQLSHSYASTVVSHIAKDGHYYIHPDPSQCRSLTVREAARLQTFPDNYFFAGNRSQQYVQVGNAVPPLLAREIARVVHSLMEAWYRSRSLQ